MIAIIYVCKSMIPFIVKIEIYVLMGHVMWNFPLEIFNWVYNECYTMGPGATLIYNNKLDNSFGYVLI